MGYLLFLGFEAFRALEITQVLEFVTTLVGFISAVMLFREYPETRLYLLGTFALLVGIVAANGEKLFFEISPDLNFVQHFVGVFAAGIIFLVYTRKNYKNTNLFRSKMNELSRGK